MIVDTQDYFLHITINSALNKLCGAPHNLFEVMMVELRS